VQGNKFIYLGGMAPAARELQICTIVFGPGAQQARIYAGHTALRLPPVSLAFARSWVTAVVVMLTVMLPSCCNLPCMDTHSFATMMTLSSLGRATAPSSVAPVLMLVRMPRRAEA